MSRFRWLPASNVVTLHAVRDGAEVFRRPDLRTRTTYAAVKAVCGREIELATARVIGVLPRCGHCVKAVGDG